MRSLSIECVLLVQNAFSDHRMCSLTIECVLIGTIAEAASSKLPILLFDFLPGQEEGNVTHVCDTGMGEYEKDPSKV